jgi:hypothetical protein
VSEETRGDFGQRSEDAIEELKQDNNILVGVHDNILQGRSVMHKLHAVCSWFVLGQVRKAGGYFPVCLKVHRELSSLLNVIRPVCVPGNTEIGI